MSFCVVHKSQCKFNGLRNAYFGLIVCLSNVICINHLPLHWHKKKPNEYTLGFFIEKM